MSESAIVSASVWRRSTSCCEAAIAWCESFTGHAELLQVVDRRRRRKSLPTSSGVRSKYVPTSSGSGRLRVAEQEELDLGSDVARQAQVVRTRSIARFRTERGSPSKGSPSGVRMSQNMRATPDMLGPPREELERRRVGVRDHVGLLHAREPVDRRAVEADSLAERLRQLLDRDRERLQEPEHVREPQPDEPDLAFLRRPEDELAIGVDHPSSRARGRVGHLGGEP